MTPSLRFAQSDAVSVAVAPAAAASFLGWRILLVGFTANFLNTACTFGAFGVFVIPLAEEFGASRAAITTAPGVAMLLGAPLGLLIGRWVDRGPVRLMMVGGLLLCVAGLLLLARSSELLWIGALYCTLVFGGANLCGPMPAMALLGKWFARRRGIALGLAVAGSTIATAAAPYLAARLVSSIGWRGAVDVFALAMLAIGLPIFALFVVRSPEEVGQHPDGASEPPPEVAGGAAAERVSIYLRERNFYLWAFGFALLFTSPIVNATFFVSFAQDLGLTREQAALPLVPLAIFSLIGKLAFGVIGDRMDPRRAARLAIAVLIGGWIVLLSRPGFAWLLVGGALMGLGVGAVAPLQGVVAGRCFGRDALGRILGVGGIFMLPIVAGATPLASVLSASRGGYELAFAVEAAALGLAGVLLSLVRLPPLLATASAADASPRLSPVKST